MLSVTGAQFHLMRIFKKIFFKKWITTNVETSTSKLGCKERHRRFTVETLTLRLRGKERCLKFLSKECSSMNNMKSKDLRFLRRIMTFLLLTRV